MTFLSTSKPSSSSSSLSNTSKLQTNSLHPHPPKQSPTLSHLQSNSASPSPTSSTSSFLSYFDNRSFGERRESACSNTSWGSMGETPSSKPPDREDISMEEQEDKPSNPRMASSKSVVSNSSSGSGNSSLASSPDPKLSTPDFSSSTERLPPFVATSNNPTQPSPSSSTASKGECTPRAELPAPVWPHASSSSPARKSDYYEEPFALPNSDDTRNSTVRKPSLRRNGSWRRKHAR